MQQVDLPTLPAVAHVGPSAPAHLGKATAIMVDTADVPGDLAAGLWRTAELLAEDLAKELDLPRRPQIRQGTVAAHAVGLRLSSQVDSPEGYILHTDGATVITGADPAGVYWGTQTLVQLVRGAYEADSAGGRGVELQAHVIDSPEHGERAVMLDCGRKYFSPDSIKRLVREMSYLKLNTLQMHISDNVGFRVECESYPMIVSEEHLTRSDVRDIIAYARDRHVEIILDLDTPSHLDHILESFPEYRLTLQDGTVLDNALDITIPEARDMVKDILLEMMDVFASDVVHIGGDEYLPAPWQEEDPSAIDDTSARHVAEWAQGVTGDARAGALDAYVLYMNEIAECVREHGSTARMWSDDIYPGQGVVRVDQRTQADVWIRWDDSKPTAEDIVDDGHEIMNANGDYLYFILTEDGIGTGPTKNPTGIYESWDPRRFMGAAGDEGDFDLPARHPMLGAHLSVWCDSPPALTQEEVLDNLLEWMQSFSQQVWGGEKIAPTFAELTEEVVSVVGSAP